MPQLGPLELVLILAAVLIIFGAGKLPEVFGSFGKGIREFRKASSGEDDVPPARPAVTSAPPQEQAPVASAPASSESKKEEPQS